ncbi:MAG TPA: S-methyl-5-thioribose-1-phosphate isomerase [Candidatus Krumholzibacteria bacterium]|nr:S-methyl-5-thioribose-1-phosphate isomerase [Candidatus Krumholzibacteria bacterium]
MLTAIPTVRFANGRMRIIDQTLLPSRYEIIALANLDAVCEAIKSLRVRGAPAIGVSGAYGLLVAVEEKWGKNARMFDSGINDAGEMRAARLDMPGTIDVKELCGALDAAAERIVATRPTAVNLSWAVNRMRSVWKNEDDAHEICRRLITEADAILAEDLDMGRAMTSNGAVLLKNNDQVLTHCNTGGLCSGGIGTALGVVFAAVAGGAHVSVFADETRPLLQGARLTAWECRERGIPATVLVDGAAASLLSSGKVSCVMVGADRIARNGDTANKIGTMGLAIIAKQFKVPFYVVAPTSTIDRSLRDGAAIPVEHRADDEVVGFAGVRSAPTGVAAYNPAFDVTPAQFITAIVTERGVHRAPYDFGSAV